MSNVGGLSAPESSFSTMDTASGLILGFEARRSAKFGSERAIVWNI